MERIILEVDLLYKDALFPFVFIQIRFLSRERSLGGAVRKKARNRTEGTEARGTNTKGKVHRCTCTSNDHGSPAGAF